MRKMLLEFSSLRTVNKNLYFNLLLEDYTVSVTEGYIVLMPISETDYYCPTNGLVDKAQDS